MPPVLFGLRAQLDIKVPQQPSQDGSQFGLGEVLAETVTWANIEWLEDVSIWKSNFVSFRSLVKTTSDLTIVAILPAVCLVLIQPALGDKLLRVLKIPIVYISRTLM